ncbi:MAG: D-glycerate dehydrogenase, partial [Candidatus Thorarchaeota archaeon]
MTVNVFVTRKIPESGLCRIQNTFNTKVWDSVEPPSQKKIIELATNCQGLVTLLSDRIDGHLMDSLPDLRVIAQYAVGYDNIDVAEATKRGIIVTNTPG